MSFLKKSDGKAVQKKTEHTGAGGNDVFPVGTITVAVCDSVAWKAPSESELQEDREAQDRIGLMWRVQGGEFDNRVGFQTLRVIDKDEKKRDSALEWYAALDTILNEGMLLEMGEEPSDEELEKAWVGKRAEITWDIWYSGKGVTRKEGGNFPKHIVAVGDSASTEDTGSRRRRRSADAEETTQEETTRRRRRA